MANIYIKRQKQKIKRITPWFAKLLLSIIWLINSYKRFSRKTKELYVSLDQSFYWYVKWYLLFTSYRNDYLYKLHSLLNIREVKNLVDRTNPLAITSPNQFHLETDLTTITKIDIDVDRIKIYQISLKFILNFSQIMNILSLIIKRERIFILFSLILYYILYYKLEISRTRNVSYHEDVSSVCSFVVSPTRLA